MNKGNPPIPIFPEENFKTSMEGEGAQVESDSLPGLRSWKSEGLKWLQSAEQSIR